MSVKNLYSLSLDKVKSKVPALSISCRRIINILIG
jgi:hypothetical protein